MLRFEKWELQETKKDQIRCNNIQQNKYACKHCGHKQILIAKVDKQLCNLCGHWIFKNEKDEFKFRMQEALKKGKKDGRKEVEF